eukprot:3696410-Pyramimonas_sp.AAC.1
MAAEVGSAAAVPPIPPAPNGSPLPSERGTLPLRSLRFDGGFRDGLGRPRLPEMAPGGPPML